VRYPQVGLRWDATRRLSFGVTYRHSFLLESDLKFRIDGSIGNPGLPPVVEKAFLAASTFTGDLFQPWQLTAGAAYRFARNVMVAFDLTFARWSEFPGAAALVDIELDIGPQFNNQVMLPPNRSYPAPGFRDILIPRLGVEWRAKEGDRVALDTRFGYIYEPSPVPDQIGEETFADCDKHTFSLGAGVEVRNLGPVLPKPLAIDLYFAATALPSRHTRKLDPVDKVGDFRADGALIGVGLDLRTRF
jgi:long-chain fatty acid transport protein